MLYSLCFSIMFILRHKAQGISFMVSLRDEILLHTPILSPPARAQVRGDDNIAWG